MFRPATNDKMHRPRLNVKQYAALVGLTPRAIQLRIKAGTDLVGVESISTFGGSYELNMVADYQSVIDAVPVAMKSERVISNLKYKMKGL